MAYSSSTKKITPPVNFADIQSALGESSSDLATLFASNAINIWAKYKPIRKAMIDTTGQLNSDMTWKMEGGSDRLGSKAWWRGEVADVQSGILYGIKPKGFYIGTDNNRAITALEQLAAAVKNRANELNGWEYYRPTGGTSQPYRMIDFNHYNGSNTTRPVAYFSGTNPVEGSTTSVWPFSADVRGTAFNDTTDSIDYRDYIRLIDILPNGIMGMAIYRIQNSTYKAMAWCTGFTWYGVGVLGSNEGIVVGQDNVKANFVHNGKYYALPVIWEEELTQVDGTGRTLNGYSKQPTHGNQNVYSVPYTTFFQFEAKQRATSQAIALPRVSPQKLGGSGSFVYYSGSILLDTTVEGYVGSTISVHVEYALVTEAWRGNIGDMSQNEYVAGSYGTWDGVVPDEQVITIKSFTGVNALTGLNAEEGYRWIIYVAGEKKEYNLLSPYNPNV